MPLATMGAIMGGNVRVGLEDSLYSAGAAGEVQCRAGRQDPPILEELAWRSPRPTRPRDLGLKGGDEVGF